MKIHIETIYEGADTENCIPSCWVVRFWDGRPGMFPEVEYFATKDEALKFEDTLAQYDDWVTSQEWPENY